MCPSLEVLVEVLNECSFLEIDTENEKFRMKDGWEKVQRTLMPLTAAHPSVFTITVRSQWLIPNPDGTFGKPLYKKESAAGELLLHIP